MYNLLLPANKVSGKVMFLHMSVVLFTGVWLPNMHHRSHDQPKWASASKGSAFRVFCIQGFWIQGVYLQGGWADSHRTRALCILLECFLVLDIKWHGLQWCLKQHSPEMQSFYHQMPFNCRKRHLKLYQSKFILLHGYNMQHCSSLLIRQCSLEDDQESGNLQTPMAPVEDLVM